MLRNRRIGVLPTGQCFGEHLIEHVVKDSSATIPHERWCSVLALGALDESLNQDGTDGAGAIASEDDAGALVLRVDGDAYGAACPKRIMLADRVLERRVTFLYRLALFETWPVNETAFLAYYMREFTAPVVCMSPPCGACPHTVA